MDAVLVIGIKAVVVEIHRDDVRERKFLDGRLRVARAVEEERQEHQGFSKTERDASPQAHPALGNSRLAR